MWLEVIGRVNRTHTNQAPHERPMPTTSAILDGEAPNLSASPERKQRTNEMQRCMRFNSLALCTQHIEGRSWRRGKSNPVTCLPTFAQGANAAILQLESGC